MAVSKEQLLQALIEDLANELAAITQYMWHHVTAKGMESPAIMEQFRSASMDEMKHAEKLAERIDYLGGTPTTKPTAIKMGGDLRKMIQDDLDAEHGAISRYSAHIQLAAEANDPATRLMLEGILTDEEDHAHMWETILSK
ncbi:MAG: ferritin-like domain-containing protein [Dehalococcoidia bacterium]|nr:ferritin-like domain-containing protein [Dehalococcoidia bacterium]